jgi:hypothetical protein
VMRQARSLDGGQRNPGNQAPDGILATGPEARMRDTSGIAALTGKKKDNVGI